MMLETVMLIRDSCRFGHRNNLLDYLVEHVK
jgi:hypothetical protein